MTDYEYNSLLELAKEMVDDLTKEKEAKGEKIDGCDIHNIYKMCGVAGLRVPPTMKPHFNLTEQYMTIVWK